MRSRLYYRPKIIATAKANTETPRSRDPAPCFIAAPFDCCAVLVPVVLAGVAVVEVFGWLALELVEPVDLFRTH
jgi:hypothetical protein